VAGQFVEDLKASVAEVKANPQLAKQGSAAMYGLVAKIPSDSIVETFLTTLFSKVYDRNRT
jgi:hypothetical protein